jgi:uncharacterized membrane protein
MKTYEIKKEAREALRGKWGKGVDIVLAYLLISFAMGIFSGFFEENSLISLVLSVVELIISVPLSFGLAWAFLKLKRNEEASSFEFLNMGINNFSRSWKIAGRTLLKLILPIIILLGSVFAFLGVVVYSTMQLSIGVTSGLGATMIIGIIIYLVAIIYFVSVSLLYSLTAYIAYDNKEMTASEVVAESARLMKGNRGKLIWLELTFMGWAILTIFTLGIGYLWLLPYMQVAIVCFYEKLVQTRATIQSQEIKSDEEPIKNM